MRVLFVSSGNSKEGISPIVKNQGESLAKAGCHVDYFTINGKGLQGYLVAVPTLREKLHQNTFDIIHAHYSLSAFTATLAGAKPLVVSLMGSDVNERKWYKWLIRIVASLRWNATIVKSETMKKSLAMQDVKVIPNGVDLQHFKEIDKKKRLINLDGTLSISMFYLLPIPIDMRKTLLWLNRLTNSYTSKMIKLNCII